VTSYSRSRRFDLWCDKPDLAGPVLVSRLLQAIRARSPAPATVCAIDL
jgi:hypothetical protein